jgi:hypothetical protein
MYALISDLISVSVPFSPAIDKNGSKKNNNAINLTVNLLRITLFKDHLKIAAKLWFYIKNKNNFELYFIPKSNPRD